VMNCDAAPYPSSTQTNPTHGRIALLPLLVPRTLPCLNSAHQAPIEYLKTGSTAGTPGPAVLEALEAAITSRVAEFNDRDVSSALYGYAQLRLRRQQSWPIMAALVSRAQSLLAQGACSPRCTSMTLWALATLFGSSSSSGRIGGGSSSSSGGCGHGVPAYAFAAAAADQMASDAVDFTELGSQGVANSVWGTVKLGVKREELMAKSLEWLAANSSSAKMQVCMCVCLGGGGGGYSGSGSSLCICAGTWRPGGAVTAATALAPATAAVACAPTTAVYSQAPMHVPTSPPGPASLPGPELMTIPAIADVSLVLTLVAGPAGGAEHLVGRRRVPL
jgi:hypothetical protein